MGKIAVFVLSTLQQIEPVAGQVAAFVLCHTRELVYQICHEFERFSTYLPDNKVVVFYGGVNIKIHKDLLKNECPHIVPMEIYVDDEAKLTLNGLVQHYIKLTELEKNHKLNDLLDALEFK